MNSWNYNLNKKSLQDYSVQELIDLQILNHLEKISHQINLLHEKLNKIRQDI